MDNILTREEIFGTEEFLPKLVDELDHLFPPVNPTPYDTYESLMYQAGQRRVVEFLKTKLEK